MILAICICTFQRQEMLDELLSSIERAHDPGCAVRIVIVDNDAAGSAKEVVDRHSRLDVSFDVEPRRSISAVRNRSVRVALDLDPDLVAFLDDDEYVDEAWLSEIVGAFERFPQARAVAGPVVPVLAHSAPDWIHGGHFFDRPRNTTGSRAKQHNLANATVAAATLAEIPDPFGKHFGVPGGEDKYFLARLAERIGDPYWCDEAVVYETVPPERATARWLLTRSFRFGRAYSEFLRVSRSPRRQLAVRALKCCMRIGGGAAALPVATFRGKSAIINAAGDVCGGAGGLIGLGTGVE